MLKKICFDKEVIVALKVFSSNQQVKKPNRAGSFRQVEFLILTFFSLYAYRLAYIYIFVLYVEEMINTHDEIFHR